MAVPKLRFPEFTDDWEQRKLGDLYTERNERGNGSLQILSVSIHTGVSDGELDVDNLGKFVRRSEDKSTYKHVHSGDLIFNMMRAWQGAIGVAKTEGMISPAYISAIPSEDIYPPFMNYLLRRKDVINQINNLSYGVTDFRKRLYWNSFVQVNCKLPSVEEQRNITDVFEKIDHLITLHQRKLDDIKLLKKSMLQKMFPAEGRDVPEVRFPGFTAAWEQRKFGDVFEEYSEKNHEDLPPLTIVQGSGTIPREESGRDIKYDKSSLNNYKLVNPGDFILHLRSFEGGLEVANSQGIVSPAYHIFRGIRTDSRFYYPFFRSHDFINILLKPHVYGIRDGKSIDVEGMKSIKIPYPDFDEQKRIGDFFDHLDNAITLHQRKCDDLQKLKKALLQQMFC